MDGDLNPLLSADTDTADAVARERSGAARPDRTEAHRPKTLRWLLIVGVLLALVLGGFYGFNRYRAQAIANFFANNKPPPAQIAAVTATTETVPRFATGIGSLAAVHQVTITPEIGGLATAILFEPGATVKAGDRWCSSTTPPTEAISPIMKRRHAGRRRRWSVPSFWRKPRPGRARG